MKPNKTRTTRGRSVTSCSDECCDEKSSVPQLAESWWWWCLLIKIHQKSIPKTILFCCLHRYDLCGPIDSTTGSGPDIRYPAFAVDIISYPGTYFGRSCLTSIHSFSVTNRAADIFCFPRFPCNTKDGASPFGEARATEGLTGGCVAWLAPRGMRDSTFFTTRSFAEWMCGMLYR